MGWEEGFRLYLAAIVLVPLGVLCVLLGWGLPKEQSQVAITLLVLGAGMLVFGAFGPRMEGRFSLGATGVEGGLSAAKLATFAAARDRLREAEANREISADELPALETAALAAVLGSASVQRFLVQGPPSPADAGRALGDTLIGARVDHDRN